MPCHPQFDIELPVLIPFARRAHKYWFVQEIQAELNRIHAQRAESIQYLDLFEGKQLPKRSWLERARIRWEDAFIRGTSLRRRLSDAWHAFRFGIDC